MARIRKIYEDAAMTTQIMPQTHEKAVVDDNGTTLESKLGIMNQVIQQKQFEVGAVEYDLAPTEDSAHWVTSGGVYNAIEAAKVDLADDDEYVTEIDLTDRFYLGRFNTANPSVGDVVTPLSLTSQSANYCSASEDCEEGDKFSVTLARKDSSHYPVLFLDKDNKVISRHQPGSGGWTNASLTAPTGAKKILVTATVVTRSLKKKFDTPTRKSKSGVVFPKYKNGTTYGTNNTRNGSVSLSKTGIMTVTEGTTNQVMTDAVWIPKDTRLTLHVEGEYVWILFTYYTATSPSADNWGRAMAITTAGTYTIKAATNAVLTFKFTKSDSSDFTPADMTSYVKVEYPNENSIADYNADKDLALFAASRHQGGSQASGGLSNRAFPMFCVVTDVHSSWKQLERVLDFADSRSEILGTLFLGDIISSTGYSPSYGQQYKDPVNDMIKRHTKPLLRVSGNHDGNLTRAQYMATWFPSDVVAKTGETHPEGCPWWYKDFSITFNSTTKTLRVIGNFDNDAGATDAAGYYGTSDEQYNWICERLAECDENTYVMILRHFSTIDVTEENLVTDWRMKSKYWSPTGDSEHNQGKLCGIVNAWMYAQNYSSGNVSYDFSQGSNRAKNFVCYLTGHWHKDYILKHPTYPQIDIAQCCTAVQDDNTGTVNYRYSRGDLPISTTGKNMDSFNIVGVNWNQREVRLIRMGSDVTTDMRDRKMTCIELPNISEE